MCNIVGGGTNNIEESSQDSEKINLELNIGVFFDGTLNSKANIDERKEIKNTSFKFTPFSLSKIGENLALMKKKFLILDLLDHRGSYHNEYTNVVRFFNCFNKPEKSSSEKKYIPIYIEGIGAKPRKLGVEENTNTSQNEENVDSKKKKSYEDSTMSLNQFVDDNDGFITCSDDTLGSALGIGLFGVKKKVEAACEKIRDAIKALDLQENTDVTLNLYVFGFSRGSAAARCFSSFLKERTGETNVKLSVSSVIIGVKTITFIKDKLKKENQYKTSLMTDWLDDFSEEKQIKFSDPKVKFLGVYDTVSSYGAKFDDDVDELSLKIDSKNVENVYQICAGDEYRKNFALTNILSAGGKEKYIIIPGAHSDVGGGYAHNIKEGLKTFIKISNSLVGISSGHKGKKMLLDEGWFKPGESERTISNLYSVIPFLLMKDKVVNCNSVFIADKLDDYQLPSSESLEIDGIDHKYSQDLCDFYNKLKSGDYDSYYRMEENTIKSLSKEEHDLSSYISDLELQKICLETDIESDMYMNESLIEELEKTKEETNKKLDEVRQKKSNYDEDLLKKIRHDFLHLSAKSKDLTDPIVNGADKNNNRTVIKG
ncbi:MAG: DUF2235 domain-containing protein [Bacteroidales bacterium]|jgi:hypothetical protein|nr:DUF2235 domain-containing protein [Bacteroidales bacterium]